MKRKALVVDDDESMLRILTAVLETEGFEAITVPDAGEAIARMKGERFDLLITDVLMPGAVGVRSIFRFMESLPERPPAIVISAYWDEDSEMRRTYEEKADGCLTKPFELEDFRRLVRKVCGDA
ncbi:MAG: response regulator [bacterium]